MVSVAFTVMAPLYGVPCVGEGVLPSVVKKIITPGLLSLIVTCSRDS
jgi:hypothetical protein